MKVKNMTTPHRSRNGFTLIEVMVVVGIIVLLIALLIPAVSAARGAARKTGTTAQMRNIATACDAYYQTFEAYPGLLSESTYTGGTTIGFSSSQALLLSLSRAFYTSQPASPQTATTVTGTGLYTADDPSVSPKDYSVGSGRSYNAFLNPSPNELSSSIGVFAITGSKTTEIPVLVDNSYGSDALPILYYRPVQKYDSSVQDSANNYMKPVADKSGGTPPFAAFYSASNDYLWTDPTNQSNGSKTFINSSLINLTSANTGAFPGIPSATKILTTLLFNGGPNGPYTAKGSYVLISAGADRTYGPDPKGNVDDIVVAGGS